MGKVTKGIREEVKEDTEARKVTKEEAKAGTKDGTREEVTKEARDEVNQAKGSSPTPKDPASNVGVKGISP